MGVCTTKVYECACYSTHKGVCVHCGTLYCTHCQTEYGNQKRHSHFSTCCDVEMSLYTNRHFCLCTDCKYQFTKETNYGESMTCLACKTRQCPKCSQSGIVDTIHTCTCCTCDAKIETKFGQGFIQCPICYEKSLQRTCTRCSKSGRLDSSHICFCGKMSCENQVENTFGDIHLRICDSCYEQSLLRKCPYTRTIGRINKSHRCLCHHCHTREVEAYYGDCARVLRICSHCRWLEEEKEKKRRRRRQEHHRHFCHNDPTGFAIGMIGDMFSYS